MPLELKISPAVRERLRCPICRAEMRDAEEKLICTAPQCETHFPIAGGVPVLLNEEASVFSAAEMIAPTSQTFGNRIENKFQRLMQRCTPSLVANLSAKRNYERFVELLHEQTDTPRVLVVGGCTLGHGIQAILDDPSIELVETDVMFGPRTMLVCDGHDLPFADESFDGVIAQAVLEYVVDPYRCVEEMHRVLKKRAVVYADTPFMQPVHGRQYDFTRFTHLGHRRLFRRFEEIESGASCGPGSALALSYMYFLRSFAGSRTIKALARGFATLTAFYLKYFDYFLINKPTALDAASGCYFLGRRSENVLPDKELIRLYRGTK